MKYNLLNGGLVMKYNGKTYITDMKDFAKTYIIDKEHKEQIEGLFWFMNCDGSYIYYSDQKRENSLLRFDTSTQNTEMLCESPCYGLVFLDNHCYYINERDKKLYRYSIYKKNEELIIDNSVECFFIQENIIFYSTDRGIYYCTQKGEMKEEILDTSTTNLIVLGEKAFFADKENHYILTMIDIKTGEKEIFEEISPIGINTDGRYLYCSNRKHSGSIYRVDFENKTNIRIYGGSSDYLHIIDDELYFCNNFEWYRMSLVGGQPQKIY